MTKEKQLQFVQSAAMPSPGRLRKSVSTRPLDEINSQTATGRTKGDSPNVDGLVFLNDSKGLSPGDFAEVKIIDSSEHDLWAERL